MGGGGSKVSSEGNFASSSSGSVMTSGGTGEVFHSVYTGTEKDGVLSGQGLTFHQLLPVAGSFVFDCIAIFTVALFTILVIKHYRGNAAKNNFKIQRKGDVIMVEMKEFDKIETV